MRFEALGYRDVMGRFARRSEEMARGQREMVRDQSREMIAALGEEAPRATGTFAAGMHYRTDVRPGGTTATIYVRGKHAFLLPLIVRGTAGHEIPTGGSATQLAKGYPLGFFWEKGPAGPGKYHFWSVWHPGTKADDFVKRALDRRWPEMQRDLRRVAIRVAHG